LKSHEPTDPERPVVRYL